VKILQVTHYFAGHGGGVEIVAAELAQRLVERGHRVTWTATALPGEDNCPSVTSLKMRGSNVTEWMLGVPYPVWGSLSLRRLFQAVRECDVVHLHDCLYLGNVAAWIAARWHRKPVVVTQHIGLVPYRSAVLRGAMSLANLLLGRLVLGGSEQVVCYSPLVRDYFTARTGFRRPPQLIPNGVDAQRFSPIDTPERQRLRAELGVPADQPLVLFVGRFVEKKGLHLLRKVCERVTDCRWLFVGWGPDDPDNWNLPHVRRIAHAQRDEMPDYYRAADLLVLPSVGEGFPLVVQEAMSCGTPVLVSPETAAGCPEFASLNWSCPREAGAWEACLRELLGNHEQLTAMREAARKFAQATWNWDRAVDRYEAIYRAVSNPANATHETLAHGLASVQSNPTPN
jgi:glycosyltransferase involved in cell wall biosynthesis